VADGRLHLSAWSCLAAVPPQRESC
jgi:hypothetical protein